MTTPGNWPCAEFIPYANCEHLHNMPSSHNWTYMTCFQFVSKPCKKGSHRIYLLCYITRAYFLLQVASNTALGSALQLVITITVENENVNYSYIQQAVNILSISLQLQKWYILISQPDIGGYKSASINSNHMLKF